MNQMDFLKTNEKNDRYTAVKMQPELFEKAKERARSRHQSYSEYVRQLIVRDVEKNGGRGLNKRDVSQVIRIALDEFLERQPLSQQKPATR